MPASRKPTVPSYKPDRGIGQSCGVNEIAGTALEFLASSNVQLGFA